MTLQKNQVSKIRNYLLDCGLEIPAVLEDLEDHFYCIIETKVRDGQTFEAAFDDAQELLPPEDIREIQSDTIYYLTIKSKIMLVKGIFITAFLSVFTYVLGHLMQKVLFLVNIQELAYMVKYLLQTLGLVIFAFGFLPLLFRFGYKQFIARLQA